MKLQNKHLTERIISAATRVHKELGPGFLEAMYEEALAIELTVGALAFERQKLLPVFYREHLIGEHRLDFLVEGKVIVELKAISALEDIHFAIVRSYLKAANLDDALLLNFESASDASTTQRSTKKISSYNYPGFLDSRFNHG
jgi:GxxExxY protein